MSRLLWRLAVFSASLPLAAATCSSCDVPQASALSFCASFVTYSACRAGGSWNDMDTTAEEQYNTLVNGTNIGSSCATTLKRTQCMAVFNVCEMGTPETLCLDSCTEAVEADCIASLSTPTLVTVKVDACGDESNPLTGVSDEGKCFATDYDGPEKAVWVIGFTIAVVFSFLASIGINLQKKALKQNELMSEPKPAYRLPLWTLGFILCAVGSVLDFVAFGLAPQSLLAPLAALTLVWNMMLAPCFNKEKLSKKDIVSTLIIFVGATIAVVFASHTSPSYNLDMLMQLYRDPLTIVYFVVVVLTVVAHFAVIRIVDTFCLMSKRHRIIQAGTPAMWSTIRLVGYAGLAGTLGGQSVLFAKSSAELLKGVFNGDASCFVHYQTYLIAFALVVCLCLQIKYLNGGLVHYDALSMVPVYQAYWVISGVLGGVIYFQEIRTFSVLQAVMFVLGIGISIFGVVLLSRRKHAPSTASTKGKIERGFSFTSSSDSKQEPPKSSDSRLPRVPEGVATDAVVVEEEGTTRTDTTSSTSRELLSSILEALNEESATEDSDDEDSNHDRRSENESSEHVNRHAIDNYLDMSTTVGLSEILGSLGFPRSQESGLLSRRMSSRPARRRTRRSVDDIEVGLPAATREANPRKPMPKRRSITFSSFRSSSTKDKKHDNSKKDDDTPPTDLV
ncbi:NIPA-like protein 3 [Phytophthora pseudosyringae]|uniref:NIPA-like protein 3 n=1 Tax=Phytophthora pseudosyringae TaxID=221518 RepID=A0A8T1VSE2_9STRA|nr:NIPA-like protein 3 [Phytophthora pseudosyringae]